MFKLRAHTEYMFMHMCMYFICDHSKTQRATILRHMLAFICAMLWVAFRCVCCLNVRAAMTYISIVRCVFVSRGGKEL